MTEEREIWCAAFGMALRWCPRKEALVHANKLTRMWVEEEITKEQLFDYFQRHLDELYGERD